MAFWAVLRGFKPLFYRLLGPGRLHAANLHNLGPEGVRFKNIQNHSCTSTTPVPFKTTHRPSNTDYQKAQSRGSTLGPLASAPSRKQHWGLNRYQLHGPLSFIMHPKHTSPSPDQIYLTIPRPGSYGSFRCEATECDTYTWTPTTLKMIPFSSLFRLFLELCSQVLLGSR